jgi:isoleucyl-tRNA synthetase
MLRWMAPFLSFTAEEAWQVLARPGLAVFTETWRLAGHAGRCAAGALEAIREVRDGGEQGHRGACARPAGGSSLQATVHTAATPPETLDALAVLGDDLKFVLHHLGRHARPGAGAWP